jgi:hypothetical protein
VKSFLSYVLITFAVGAVIWALSGCAMGTMHYSEARGTTVHVVAVGEGALAYRCVGDAEIINALPTVTLADGTSLPLTPELLAEVRFSQLPEGECIVARGSSISEELKTLIEYYFYSKIVGAAGSLIDVGEAAVTQ